MQSYMMPSTDDGLDTDEYGRPKKRRDPSVENAGGRAVSTAPAPIPLQNFQADLQPILPNNPTPTPIRPAPDPTMTQKAMMPTTGVNDGVYDLGRIKDKGGLTAQQRVEAIRQDKAKMAQSMMPSGAVVPQPQPSAAQQMATMYPTAARIAGEGAGAFTIGENERLRTSVGGQYAMQDAGDIYGRMDALKSGNVAPGQARAMGMMPSTNWNDPKYAGAGSVAAGMGLYPGASGRQPIQSQTTPLRQFTDQERAKAKSMGLTDLAGIRDGESIEQFSQRKNDLTRMNINRGSQGQGGPETYGGILAQREKQAQGDKERQQTLEYQLAGKKNDMSLEKWRRGQTLIARVRAGTTKNFLGESTHSDDAKKALEELGALYDEDANPTGGSSAGGRTIDQSTPPNQRKKGDKTVGKDGKNYEWNGSGWNPIG